MSQQDEQSKPPSISAKQEKTQKPLSISEVKVLLLQATHNRLEELHKRKQKTLNKIEECSNKLGVDNQYITNPLKESIKGMTYSVTEIDKDITQQTGLLQLLLFG